MSVARAPLRLLTSTRHHHHESDPAEWTQALVKVCLQLSPHDRTHVEAVVVSGNGPTLVPIGTDDEPIGPAYMWLDRRAKVEAHIISQRLGFSLDPSFLLPKVLWIYRNVRELYEKTRFFLPCPEYLNLYLTGNAFTILPAPEYARYLWDQESAATFGLDQSKFPPSIPIGAHVGAVTEAAAQKLGLAEGMPVIAGAPDFLVALLGTGTIEPGRTSDRSGTSEGVNLCTDRRVDDERLLCLPHIVPGLFNLGGTISTTGKALDWVRQILGLESVSYAEILDMAATAEPGAGRLVFLPYLTGERSPLWNSCAKATFVGLTLNHGRNEILRAVIESVGFAIRDVIEVMAESNCPVVDLRVSGSQARSDLWNQVKADITGCPIRVPEFEYAELMGDACVGFTALGVHQSMSEASKSMVRIARSFLPNEGRAAVYGDLFDIYRQSYAQLKGIFDRLHGDT